MSEHWGCKFRGHHTHLSCFFQDTELRDSLGFGEGSPRLDAVGVIVIMTLYRSSFTLVGGMTHHLRGQSHDRSIFQRIAFQ